MVILQYHTTRNTVTPISYFFIFEAERKIMLIKNSARMYQASLLGQFETKKSRQCYTTIDFLF